MSEHGVKRVEDIVDLVVAFWRTAIVHAAFDLRIAEHVAAGRTTAPEVAEAAGADPRSVGVLMDALCGLGLMDKLDGRYQLEPLVERLLPYLGRMTPLTLDKEAMVTWTRLSEAVRLGLPLGATEDYWDNFARGSYGMALTQGASAARLLGLADAVGAGDGARGSAGTRILDLGCGSGGVGFGLALASPTSIVTGFDGESVLAIAAEHARELGIADRVTLRAVDVLEADSYGAEEFDLVVLAHMLHLFDAPTNAALLAKVSAALVPGGKLLIHEIVPDAERRRATYPLLFAVELLLRTPDGTPHTFPEITAWLSAAGFEGVEWQPTTGYMATITAVKP